MERSKKQSTIWRLVGTAVQHIMSPLHLQRFKLNIRQLPLSSQEMLQVVELQKQNKMEHHLLISNEIQKNKDQPHQSGQHNQSPVQKISANAIQKELKQVALTNVQESNNQGNKQKKNHQMVNQSQLQEKKNIGVQQTDRVRSSQRKNSVAQSQKESKNSVADESINLQFTLKTRLYHNVSMERADSLAYSDATYQNSNAFGFGLETTSNVPAQQPQPLLAMRINSQKGMLKAIQDQEADAGLPMERTESRECDRVRSVTEAQGSQERKTGQKVEADGQEQGQFFPTVVNEFKNKINMMRELKSQQKKRLQIEINKINKDLQELALQQAREHSSGSRINSYESRVKIADNIEAKIKAERLVRHLKYDRKLRYDSKLGKIQAIDKNINQYMEELMREKYRHDEKKKQKKKIQIIQRMKQQELRKIEAEQRKNKNIQFLQKLQLKDYDLDKGKEKQSANFQNANQIQKQNNIKQRSPTKKSEVIQPTEPTSLSRKKAYLKRVRNLNLKKQKFDQYEQVLM